MASVYDPLGFAAHIILVGKKILQMMCQDKVGWDETLKDNLRMLDLRSKKLGGSQDSTMLSAINYQGCSALQAS